MKRIIGSLFAILAIAMFMMACGDDSALKCEDGETAAAVLDKDGVRGENKCYKSCVKDEDCPDPKTQSCRGSSKEGSVKICLAKEAGGANNVNNPNSTTPPGPTTEDLALCDGYCELIYGCILSECQGYESIIPNVVKECIYGKADVVESTGCVGLLTGPQAEQAREELTGLVYDKDGKSNTCEYTENVRCGQFELGQSCGCEVPSNLGAICEKDSDTCDAGSLGFAVCAHDNFFPNGSCVAASCPTSVAGKDNVEIEGKIGQGNSDSRACGSDAACMFLNDGRNGVGGQCMGTCTKNSECGPGTACLSFATDVLSEKMIKLCIAQTCAEDADCNKNGEKGRCGETSKVCESLCEDAKATALCESGDGTCEDGADDKKFCVLP